MTEEIISICGSILCGTGMIAFTISFFCVMYLDTSNGHNKTPRVRFSFDVFATYDKDVKKEDEYLKKFSNRLARIGTITIVSGFVLIVVGQVLKLGV